MGAVAKSQVIIVVTGDAASGKSAFCGFLSHELETSSCVINVGELLRSRLQSENVEITHKAQTGPIFIKLHGVSEIFNMLNKQISNHLGDCQNIIIDGIRLLDTFNRLKATYNGSLRHLHVRTSRRLIVQRLKETRSITERKAFRRSLELEAKFNNDLNKLGSFADERIDGEQVQAAAEIIARELNQNRKRALPRSALARQYPRIGIY